MFSDVCVCGACNTAGKKVIFSYTTCDEKVIKDEQGNQIGVGDGVVGKVMDLLKKQYGHDVWWGLDMQAGATGFKEQYYPQVVKTREADGFGVLFISKYFATREYPM